jgi:hypothetical protein
MKKYIYMILIISLAFNLAFLGMFIWHRINRSHPPFPGGERQFKEHLDKDRAEMQPLMQGFMQERDKFMKYLSGEDFEESVADSLLDNMVNKQSILERRMGQKMIERRKQGIFPEKPERGGHRFKDKRERPNERRTK